MAFIIIIIFFRCWLCKWFEAPIPASKNSSKQHWRCVWWCSLSWEVCLWWHPGWTLQHLCENQYRWSCYLSVLTVWRVAFVFTGEWTSPINEVKPSVISSIMSISDKLRENVNLCLQDVWWDANFSLTNDHKSCLHF